MADSLISWPGAGIRSDSRPCGRHSRPCGDPGAFRLLPCNRRLEPACVHPRLVMVFASGCKPVDVAESSPPRSRSTNRSRSRRLRCRCFRRPGRRQGGAPNLQSIARTVRRVHLLALGGDVTGSVLTTITSGAAMLPSSPAPSSSPRPPNPIRPRIFTLYQAGGWISWHRFSPTPHLQT